MATPKKPPAVSPRTSPSLAEAYVAIGRKWKGMAGERTRTSNLRWALDTLAWDVLDCAPSTVTASQVPVEAVEQCVQLWETRDKLSPATINNRLRDLGVIGVNTDGCWKRVKLPLKWWLRPSDCDKLLAHLLQEPEPFANAYILADYVGFVSHTGLRVEENLRLQWSEVHLHIFTNEKGVLTSNSELTVPGTKTSSAQATLPLAIAPAIILRKRKELAAPLATHVFPIGYYSLHRAWIQARNFIGAGTNPLATLKSLRRTAARHLTVNGMPTEMVRYYLRHEDINTTLGYLRLTGGYSTEEMRRWL
jgi:integrase